MAVSKKEGNKLWKKHAGNDPREYSSPLTVKEREEIRRLNKQNRAKRSAEENRRRDIRRKGEADLVDAMTK
jgi:hypothetical protein